jgi:hypothetical protein
MRLQAAARWAAAPATSNRPLALWCAMHAAPRVERLAGAQSLSAELAHARGNGWGKRALSDSPRLQLPCLCRPDRSPCWSTAHVRTHGLHRHPDRQGQLHRIDRSASASAAVGAFGV